MSETLVEFVKARLDEDGEAAHRAAQIIGNGRWLPGAGRVATETLITVTEGPVDVHIARHDPARVLREVEALRRIVEFADEATGLDMQVDGEFRVESRDLKDEPYIGTVMLRSLASIWSTHPDYREEWTP